ncbi:Swarming motility protein ybiA [Thermoflavimicrobium daqui]|uniref:Swarming motility protein ybiA n=2 Tax=Thermoflavimicrobium daqui TaxID=2137476 RepID=A0A364K672_9BACL|nr:Swarming motility protein ybiA [Thermoflavimicrobium daqui]
MPIYFYRTNEKYGCFSNFASYPIELDGQIWPTSEHYFQAQKFITINPSYSEKIRNTKSPMIAAKLGRSRKIPIRPDWEDVKDDVMRKVVLCKVMTHRDVHEYLVSTGDEEIIEKTTHDRYWGCGIDGTGKNMLGKILMEVRAKLIKP